MTLPDLPDFSTYGGALQNYGQIEDPTTDLDAGAFNHCRSDVAAMALTAPRAFARFVGGTSPVLASVGVSHRAMWGSSVGVAPTPSLSATGIYLLTWPATITDALNVARTLNLGIAEAWVEIAGTTRYDAEARIIAPNVAEIRVFLGTSNALDNANGLTICVKVT